MVFLSSPVGRLSVAAPKITVVIIEIIDAFLALI